MKKTALISTILFVLPAVAFAQSLTPLANLISAVGRLVALLIPILITVALIVFFWGLIQYIRKPEAADGRKIMLAGLVSLFVMVSVWGIILLAQSALAIPANAPVQSPGVPVPTGQAYGSPYNGTSDNSTGVNGYIGPGYTNTNSYGGPR